MYFVWEPSELKKSPYKMYKRNPHHTKCMRVVLSAVATAPYILYGGPLHVLYGELKQELKACREHSFSIVSQLLVLNRKGPNHMVELLTEHYEFNDQEPYVIFRDSKAPTPTPHGMWFKSSEDRNKLWTEIQNIKALLLQQKGQTTMGGSSIGASVSGGKGFAHKGGGPDISPQQIHECIQSSNQINLQVQQMMQQQRQMHAQIQQQQQILQQQQMRIQQQQIQLSASQATPLQVQPQISGLTGGQVELSVAQLQKILMRMVQDERFVGALHAHT